MSKQMELWFQLDFIESLRKTLMPVLFNFYGIKPRAYYHYSKKRYKRK